jgi:two-component system, NtrC family, sensor kinase
VWTVGGDMQRRGQSEQSGKTQSTTRPKARKAPLKHGSTANLQDKLDQLTRELDEARQRETATAGVLKVISRSTFDLQTVLDTLTESAARLCDADMAAIAREKNSAFYYATSYGFPADYLEFVKAIAHPVDRRSTIGRTMIEGKPVQISDVLSDPEYGYLESQKRGGFRTMLGVPLLREGTAIGVLLLARADVKPFTQKQIELLHTFADQAVIAIENARLFDEVQARTRDLSEALEQQTATSEVLRVISRSPTDIQPVLDVILQTSGRLCEAEYACFFKLQDGKYHLAGSNKADADYIKYLSEHPLALDRGTLVGRAALERSTVHIPDCLADREYTAHEYARIGKHRSLLGVPLLRDGVAVGVIALLRNLVKPYTAKQVELVTSFADQAMIAIENVRLFDEVQARTRELSESLEQQTATSKVLGVISSSPTDVQPVFETIANNAVHLCGAGYCIVYSFDGEMIDVVAHYNLDRIALDALRKIWPMAPTPRALVGRIILERDVLHVADVAAESNYTFANTSQAVLGIRTFLGVPMLRGGQPIGAIGLYRREVKPFSVRQIDLVKAFADQR